MKKSNILFGAVFFVILGSLSLAQPVVEKSFDFDNSFIAIDAFNPVAQGAGNSFTLSSWVKTTAPLSNAANEQYAVMTSVGQDSAGSLLLRGGYNGLVGWIRTSIGNVAIKPVSINLNGQINDGQWHHIALIAEEVGPDVIGRLYYDGVQVKGNVVANATILKEDRAWWISRYFQSTPLSFDGQLDEMAYLPQALTGTEVFEIYDKGSAADLASFNPVFWFHNDLDAHLGDQSLGFFASNVDLVDDSVAGIGAWKEQGNSLFALNLNVGIGTDSPTSMLTVEGDVSAQALTITLPGLWPSDTFSNGYDLTPLADVVASAQADGHLPGMPVASEIIDDGLNVSDVMSRQQRKIEELILYLAQADKRADDLEAANSQLESDIESLEAGAGDSEAVNARLDELASEMAELRVLLDGKKDKRKARKPRHRHKKVKHTIKHWWNHLQ